MKKEELLLDLTLKVLGYLVHHLVLLVEFTQIRTNSLNIRVKATID